MRKLSIKYWIVTFIIFVNATLLNVYAQYTFQKTIGGEDTDAALAVENLNNGNFLIGGITESFGNSGKDIFILEIDECGSILGQKIVS